MALARGAISSAVDLCSCPVRCSSSISVLPLSIEFQHIHTCSLNIMLALHISTKRRRISTATIPFTSTKSNQLHNSTFNYISGRTIILKLIARQYFWLNVSAVGVWHKRRSTLRRYLVQAAAALSCIPRFLIFKTFS